MKKYFLYILILLVIGFSVLLLLPKNDQFIKSPNQYLPAEKLNKIILETREKTAKNPEDIFSYIEGGVALYQKGRDYYPEAINQLQRALKLGAVDLRIYFYLAIMYDELNVPERAFVYYEKFLRNRPKNFYMRTRYGNLFFHQNRYDSASEQYETALSVQPKNQTALINLALSYKARDMFDEALEEFRKAESVKSIRTPEILIKIAETYSAKKDFSSVLAYYTKAIERKPNSVAALLGLADTYLNTGYKSEAANYFQKVLEIDPANPIAKKQLSKK